MKGLTKRQREIVDFIRDYIAVNNYSPSYREIMRHFKFTSLGSVYKHISVLKRKGVLLAEKAAARSVTLSDGERNNTRPGSIELPFLGEIAAGLPIETFPEVERVSVPVSMVARPDRSYVLKVRGNSMIEDGIFDGDLVVVEGRDLVKAGETIVALVNGSEATLKRYRPDGMNIRLEPANPDFQTLVIPASQLKVQGVVKGLLRIHHS